MSGRDGSRSLARKISRTFSAPGEAASHGVTRASIADQSRPNKYFPRPGNEGGTHDKGQLARWRHVDRIRRGQLVIATAVGDRIDERSLRGAVLAEHIAGQVVDLSSARAHAAGLPGAGEAILTTQHAINLLRIDAGELFW